MNLYSIACSVAILCGVVWGLRKSYDVRFVMMCAALLFGLTAHNVFAIFDVFFATMGDGKIVGPICSAMAYAFLVRSVGADKAMVQYLLKPIESVRWLLIPGGCLVGCITNMAITSQTAAAAAVGPVLVPLLLRAGYSPAIAGSVLVLGCSSGGNLLNPGEPDIVAITRYAQIDAGSVLTTMLHPLLLVLGVVFTVATLLIWREHKKNLHPTYVETAAHHSTSQDSSVSQLSPTIFNRHPILLAVLPPLPVVILLGSLPQLNLFPFMQHWYPSGIPVVHAMILSSIVVMIVIRRNPSALTKSFAEGLGYGYVHVISVIIAASCFIEGLKIVGITNLLLGFISEQGPLSTIGSITSTFVMAVISGSGTAPSVSFSQSVVSHIATMNQQFGVEIGVLGAIGATCGRTMSPVAAIVIFAGTLTGVTPLEIVRRTAPAIILGIVLCIVWNLVYR